MTDTIESDPTFRGEKSVSMLAIAQQRTIPAKQPDRIAVY
jgi:hypothetical protein